MSRWGEEAGRIERSRATEAIPAGPRTPYVDLPVITRLLTYVGICLLVGVGVIVGARFLGAAFYPIPTFVVATTVGVLWWAVMMVADWQAYEPWEPATAVDPSLRVASDPRTRRLESMLSGADAKHRMSTRDVARILSGVVADVLIRFHGADPADPLADARRHVSAGLLDFLTAASSGTPRALTRRQLHSWLIEIESLQKEHGHHG